MKINITLTIAFVLISLQLFSQEKHESDYNKFKSYFIQAKIDSKEKQKKIPISIASNILGDEIVNENVVDIYTFEFIAIGNNETFVIEIERPQGGYTNTYYILSFYNEILSKTEIIGFNALDIDGGTRCELNMVNDTLLEVKSEEVEYNESREEKKVFNTEYNYYVIDKRGFYKVKTGSVEKARLYPQASLRILGMTELKGMEKADLDIMRNEIFADHGYIFKTEKWNKYFASQDWYNPRFEDVTDKLSIIEKINIKRILKVSPLK